MHIVGDGANVNEAAAKLFLAWVRAEPLPLGLEYVPPHGGELRQSPVQLVVGSVVSGNASGLGALLLSASAIGCACPLQRSALAVGRASVGGQVCGAIVRLFKYLVSDYFSGFGANPAELVGRLRSSTQEEAAPHTLARQDAARLQELWRGRLPAGVVGHSEPRSAVGGA